MAAKRQTGVSIAPAASLVAAAASGSCAYEVRAIASDGREAKKKVTLRGQAERKVTLRLRD